MREWIVDRFFWMGIRLRLFLMITCCSGFGHAEDGGESTPHTLSE